MPSYRPEFPADIPEADVHWRGYVDRGLAILNHEIALPDRKRAADRAECRRVILANIRAAAMRSHPSAQGRALSERQSHQWTPEPDPAHYANRSILRDLWSLIRKVFQ